MNSNLVLNHTRLAICVGYYNNVLQVTVEIWENNDIVTTARARNTSTIKYYLGFKSKVKVGP